MFSEYFFYLFSAVMAVSGFMVITVRNTVHAVMWLIVVFLNAAGLFFLLEQEFIALILILVYIGAVVVLLLFVVMMLDVNISKVREGFTHYLPLAVTLGIFLVAEVALVVGDSLISPEALPIPAPKGADYSNTTEVGLQLYTTYLFPFEVASVILLDALIGAVVLTHRPAQKGAKYQKISEQVAAGPARLRKVSSKQKINA